MATPQDVKNLSDDELSGVVEAAVREFLQSEGGADATEIDANQELWTQFDSLLIMELLQHLEDRFDVQLNTGNLSPEDMKTIARIRDAATTAIRAASAGPP